jgi:hypothetical protein
MRGLKQTVLTAVATAALLCLPIAPAVAAGPLLFVPWALGHIIGAGARLATLPLAVAAATGADQQPSTPYAPAPSYYGRPAVYYAPPNYYPRPPTYYAPPPSYYGAPQPYYRPAFAYARRTPWLYAQPRGYYAPSRGYYAPPGSFAYRRR